MSYPRTKEILSCIHDAMNESSRERAYALLDAARAAIEQLEDAAADAPYAGTLLGLLGEALQALQNGPMSKRVYNTPKLIEVIRSELAKNPINGEVVSGHTPEVEDAARARGPESARSSHGAAEHAPSAEPVDPPSSPTNSADVSLTVLRALHEAATAFRAYCKGESPSLFTDEDHNVCDFDSAMDEAAALLAAAPEPPRGERYPVGWHPIGPGHAEPPDKTERFPGIREVFEKAGQDAAEHTATFERALAATREPPRGDEMLRALADPVVVHANMLRCNIAAITMRQCAHVWGERMVDWLNRAEEREPIPPHGPKSTLQMSVASEDRLNALSRAHGELFDLARSFRDTLCRVLDTAERRTKAGRPLEQDEIDAMTARLVADTEKLYGNGRPVPPHASGPAGYTVNET